MEDFNFFEPYRGSRKIRGKQLLVYIGACTVALLIFLLPLINSYIIYRFEKEVQTTSALANAAEINEQRILIQKKTQETEKLNKYYDVLENVKSSLQEKDIINDFLIYTIRDRVPKDLFIKSIHIEPGKIQLQGVAKNKIAIAKLQYNLENVTAFEDIFIPNILGDNGNYTFTISFTIKDVTKDEIH